MLYSAKDKLTIMKIQKLFTLITFITFALYTSASVEYSQKLTVEDFDMGNMLNWKTSKETDNKHFIVEKSLDGVTFSKIGKIKGNGTTTDAKSYSFLDVSATQGQNFYRLKQVDADGKSHLSDVVSTNKETANNFTVISMNPPTDKDNIFEVTINAVGEDELDYTIYDMQGNLVYSQKQKLKKGINVITVDLSEISGDESIEGFAGNNDLLGDKVGYRVSLEGENEAEMLTIAPRNKDVKTKKERSEITDDKKDEEKKDDEKKDDEKKKDDN